MRPSHHSDSVADSRASTAPTRANRPDTSVSFFYTVRRMLRVSYTFFRSAAVPA